MGRRRTGFILFLMFVFIPPLEVYGVHKGAGGLVCGNCHVMHNSQGGQGLGGMSGGSLVLLRGQVGSRKDIHKLCLECHGSNGSQAGVSHAPQNVKAPKVYSSGSWTEDDPFNLIGAGGNFYWELDMNWDTTTSAGLGYGHSLGATSVLPPGGDAVIDEFTCTNCHDPHGTANPNDPDTNMFRNLRVRALGSGVNSDSLIGLWGDLEDDPLVPLHRRNVSYVGSVSVIDGIHTPYFGGNETDKAGQVIWPVFRGTMTYYGSDYLNSNAYATQPVFSYNTTISTWCSQCHDNWHEDISDTNKSDPSSCPEGYTQSCRDWRRHPVNTVVPPGSAPGCAKNCHRSMLDRKNYDINLIKAGKGLPVTMHLFAKDFPQFAYYYLGQYEAYPCMGCMDTGGQNVFCLTCHFAHGGPYYDALRWNYHTDVATGDQRGLGIPSTKGCQLCHNR